MKRRVVTLAVVATLIATGCGSVDVSPPPLITTTTTPGSTPTDAAPSTEPSPPDAGPTTGSTSPAPPEAILAQIDCPPHLDRDDGPSLACGTATVSLDRDDPSVGTVVITLATLEGTDPAATTPLAVLQGGPGGASTGLGAWFPQQPYPQVFVDQRGTGFAGPDLDCPEIVEALADILATDSATAVELGADAYARCAARQADDPVLDHVSTDAHAADVVDVMHALGYDRWVAYGVSYGSTIGLELMADAPVGLAGVVLDGVYPPELDTEAGLVDSAERAVDEIDATCALDDTCRAFVPDGFRTTVERVMADLDREPVVVSVDGGVLARDDDVDVVVDGRRVAELAFVLTYHESLLRHLPAVIAGLDERDHSSARWLARTGGRLLVSSQQGNDEGTYFAVQCHDRVPFTEGPGDDLPPFAAAVASADLLELCEPWARAPGGPDVAAPVESALPALLLSGSFDPITPPEYAESVAARLSAATVVEQGGRGHGIWYGDDCIASIVAAFVAAPAAVPDTDCADEPVPVEWAQP